MNEELKTKAKKDGAKLVFDRFEEQQPQCVWGLDGTCCKNCFAGACRYIEKKQERGVCGATREVICARNLLRAAVGGAASHADHAREVVLTLFRVAEGKAKGYEIKDAKKLKVLAEKLGKETRGKKIEEIAKDVALEALEDFRRQHGIFTKTEGVFLNWLRITASKERINKWKELDILPDNADIETTRAIHATTMGNDSDMVHLLLTCLKIGLVDGYAGLHLSTNLQDVLFGTPTLTKTETNLGTIKEDEVNIAVHGHVPLLSEKIVEGADKLEKEAKKVGAKGINVVGVCCTGNEVLMRHGIGAAAHILQSELPIVTGALEAMVVDAQCIYPSLQDVASCYHTKLITTMVARIEGATHIPFEIESADENAKEIVMTAVKNFPNRNESRVMIPHEKTTAFGGVSVETIVAALSKVDPKDPLKPLIDNIAKGNILGVVAVVGYRNPKLRDQDFGGGDDKNLA